jgi:hypothetical protein
LHFDSAASALHALCALSSPPPADSDSALAASAHGQWAPAHHGLWVRFALTSDPQPASAHPWRTMMMEAAAAAAAVAAAPVVQEESMHGISGSVIAPAAASLPASTSVSPSAVTASTAVSPSSSSHASSSSSFSSSFSASADTAEDAEARRKQRARERARTLAAANEETDDHSNSTSHGHSNRVSMQQSASAHEVWVFFFAVSVRCFICQSFSACADRVAVCLSFFLSRIDLFSGRRIRRQTQAQKGRFVVGVSAAAESRLAHQSVAENGGILNTKRLAQL